MRISVLALEVARLEGKKREVNIAQIKEVLRVINDITDGEFYKLIRKMR